MTNTVQIVGMFAFTLVTQLAGMSLLPRTDGFTQPFWSIASLTLFGLGIWMMARLSQAGVALSVLIPLLSAMAPLGAIAIGILVYGETASVSRVGALVAACGLIGLASRIS